MNVKSFITNNFGLKLTALVLAFIVWAMITGKERSYSEKTLDVNVEYFNVGKNIDISSVRPEKVRVIVRGTSKQLERVTAGDFKIKFDLKDVTEDTRLNFFTEDHLQLPEDIKGLQLVNVHPRMIEITVKEFVTVEIPVRVRYKGAMPEGVLLIDRVLVPDKVRVTGYKSQIDDVSVVDGTESVNLSTIMESKTIRIPLKKEKEILRFEGKDYVDVQVTVENKNKKVNEEKKENGSDEKK